MKPQAKHNARRALVLRGQVRKHADTFAQRARLRAARARLEKFGIDTGDLCAEEIMQRAGEPTDAEVHATFATCPE